MLGYELKDFQEMKEALYRAKVYLPQNESNDAIRAGLEKVDDFLDGLDSEGYFD